MLTRILTTLLGVLFILFGAALAWLPFVPTQHQHAYLAELLIVSLGAFIGLFGASMGWQSVRGARTDRGFFIRWLRGLSSIFSPAGLFAALSGIALGSSVLGMVLTRPHDTDSGRALLVALIAFHVHIGLHELGHLCATYFCRYRPKRVVVGAFAATPSARRWRLQPNRDWRFVMGGAVLFAADYNRRTWSRDVLCYAAGPFATLVSIGTILVAQTLCGSMPQLAEFLQRNLTFAMGVLVFNLLPLQPFRTDGYELLELWNARGDDNLLK